MDLDEFSELESRLVGVVSRPILGEVSVGNHRVRASDFNFRYAPHNGTRSEPKKTGPSDCFRPVSEIVLICDVGHFHAAKELIKGILG